MSEESESSLATSFDEEEEDVIGHGPFVIELGEGAELHIPESWIITRISKNRAFYILENPNEPEPIRNPRPQRRRNNADRND